MIYDIQKWTLQKLIDTVKDKKINLNPPYQRNDIWTVKMKEKLIDSILKNYPLPSFFINEYEDKKYNMVEGQQRTRAILSYHEGIISCNKCDFSSLSDDQKKNFREYPISVTVINKSEEDEIVDFYSRINREGIQLNKLELIRAEFNDSNFYKLVSQFLSDDRFIKLDIFTNRVKDRLNDYDFVSELITLLSKGITDKKDSMEALYQKDISEEELIDLQKKFNKILERFLYFNDIFPINKTRYKQKNDFYSLFGFIDKYSNLSPEFYQNFYKTLVIIDDEISPTNKLCPSFKEYALNCVTQSNSSKERNNRNNFYVDLFLNNNDIPTTEQKDIIDSYHLDISKLVNIGNYYVLDLEALASNLDFDIDIFS